MNELQELSNIIKSEQYCLEKLQGNKKYILAYLANKRNRVNSLVEEYKETMFKNVPSRIQRLKDIERRLSDLQAVPMQNMHLEIEHLKSEARPLYCNVEIDTEAPEISTEEMKHVFRVVKYVK